jgi:hypothetical protein
MEKTIEKLKALLSENLPNATVEVDAPESAEGTWWIDVHSGKKRVTLEYRPQKGFGLFREDGGYGEGPSEVYRTPGLAARRVAQVIAGAAGKQTRLTLKELRELYLCSQVKMAEKVGVKQSAISRFEQRSEMKVGTLSAAVEALGGKLEIRAHFPDADVPISIR